MFGFTALSPSTLDPIKTNHEEILCYEQSGNFALALKIAKEEPFLHQEIIDRLEREILSLGYSRTLFDEDLKPRVKLIQLLEHVGMDTQSCLELTANKINDWAQKNLLRQGERSEKQTNQFEELRPKIKPLLTELGFIDATIPSFKEYQGALVHGGMLSRTRHRLHYLVEQWKLGIRFSHLYFLSGARPLDPLYENENAMIEALDSPLKIRSDWKPTTIPTTECEMTELVFEQSEIPEEMRKQVKVHFIQAPMKKDPKSDKLLRPTTDDTVVEWLKLHPLQGRYLTISNAPYTLRQDIVMRTLSPKEYGFDAIGAATKEQEKMAIILDEVARTIFQINKFNQ